jgi:hypothetical protein
MSPEERSLLERTYKMVEENNNILLSIRRNARIGTAMKFIYWAVIIGLSFGAYYFIQPYIEILSGTLLGGGNIEKTVNGIGNIQSTVSQIQDLLK